MGTAIACGASTLGMAEAEPCSTSATDAAGIEPLSFFGDPAAEPSYIGWMPRRGDLFSRSSGHMLEYLAMLDEPRRGRSSACSRGASATTPRVAVDPRAHRSRSASRRLCACRRRTSCCGGRSAPVSARAVERERAHRGGDVARREHVGDVDLECHVVVDERFEGCDCLEPARCSPVGLHDRGILDPQLGRGALTSPALIAAANASESSSGESAGHGRRATISG